MAIREYKFTDEQVAEILTRRGLNEREDVKGKVIAIIGRANGDTDIIHGLNIVTNAGDLYYAQNGAGEAHTVSFHDIGGMLLGTSDTAPAKTDTSVTTKLGSSSGKAIKSGYPKTNDADAQNTGAGTDIVTWTYEWAAGEDTGTGIQEGAIVNDLTTPTAALSHFLFAASWDKAAGDTAKVVVNHEFSGV